MRHDQFNDAFVKELSHLISSGSIAPAIADPSSPASSFGEHPRKAIELLGTSFTVASPHHALVSSPILPLNISLAVGLTLWTLAGSNDNATLKYYDMSATPRRNPAWGDRLFANRGVDQIERAISLLQSDPATRRAFLPILGVEHTDDPAGGIPCAAGVQFFLREGALHCVAVMRAQNALTSLALDVFVLSHLLFYVADRLGVSIGSYTHMCGTFHIFVDQRPQAHALLSDHTSVSVSSLGQSVGISADLRSLLELEAAIRQLVEAERVRVPADLKAEISAAREFHAPLSTGFATVLLATAMLRAGIERAEIEGSLPGSRELFRNTALKLGGA